MYSEHLKKGSTGGLDFVALDQTLIFLPDTTQHIVQLEYLHDDVVESTENFNFYLSVPMGEVGIINGRTNQLMNIRDTDSMLYIICCYFYHCSSQCPYRTNHKP